MYGKLKAAGEGFYLHDFQVPDTFTGKRVLLHFDGVWSSAEVWLNAIPLGRHDSGFTSFAFDVTGILKPGLCLFLAKTRQMRIGMTTYLKLSFPGTVISALELASPNAHSTSLQSRLLSTSCR